MESKRISMLPMILMAISFIIVLWLAWIIFPPTNQSPNSNLTFTITKRIYWRTPLDTLTYNEKEVNEIDLVIKGNDYTFSNKELTIDNLDKSCECYNSGYICKDDDCNEDIRICVEYKCGEIYFIEVGGWD